jgi:hypothetical protein
MRTVVITVFALFLFGCSETMRSYTSASSPELLMGGENTEQSSDVSSAEAPVGPYPDAPPPTEEPPTGETPPTTDGPPTEEPAPSPSPTNLPEPEPTGTPNPTPPAPEPDEPNETPQPPVEPPVENNPGPGPTVPPSDVPPSEDQPGGPTGPLPPEIAPTPPQSCVHNGVQIVPPSDQSLGRKVLICHIPPGNPANRHELYVGEPSVAAHLEHGDLLGCCE